MSMVAAMILPNAALASPASDIPEREIQVKGPSGGLAGAMLSPEPADGPVVLIVPGSGPTDRDGNSPAGVRASTYRLLAEGLAVRGIASVRIDKRGLYASRGAATDPNAVTLDDYVADVRAWVAAIRGLRPVSHIWVLGHSEGGLVALAAASSTEDVRGLILLATPGRPLGAVLRDQLRGNPANAPLLDEAFSAIASLERGEHIDDTTMAPALRPLFRRDVQGLLISLLAVDPVELIAVCRLPILILQGLRDIQVGRKDAETLARADRAARLILLADANHVFKTLTSDDRAANVAAYLDADRPLAAGALEAIADFVAEVC